MSHDALIDRLINEVIPDRFQAMPGFLVWQSRGERQAFQAGYVAALRHMVELLNRIRAEDVH